MGSLLIRLEAEQEIKEQQALQFKMRMLLISLANWFIALRNQLGYDDYSNEAKNLEFTFLQGLYETVSANLQSLDYPKRDFDPDDFGGSNNIYDNQAHFPE